MLQLDRRDFLKSAGAGLTAAGVMLTPREQALAQAQAEKNRLDRIAGCSYRFAPSSRAGPAVAVVLARVLVRGAGAGRSGSGRTMGSPAAPAAEHAPARPAQPRYRPRVDQRRLDDRSR